MSPKEKSWTKMPRKPVSRVRLRRPDAGREVVSMTQRWGVENTTEISRERGRQPTHTVTRSLSKQR